MPETEFKHKMHQYTLQEKSETTLLCEVENLKLMLHANDGPEAIYQPNCQKF